MTTPELDDDLRSRNQQRIDALRDRVIARHEDYRQDTAVERAPVREETADETITTTRTNSSTKEPTSTPA